MRITKFAGKLRDMDPNEFYKYATKHQGIGSMTLQRYTSIWGNYISPTIIEERQLNVASDFSDALTKKVEHIIEDACKRAVLNGRTTVMPKDL